MNQVIKVTGGLVGAGLMFTQTARAHCDTMDGPVVVAAQTALKNKDITPILKWVKPEAEPEIKETFARALAVRTQGAEARQLADQFFFETLVRVHRAGEGAPFTGLKPAGAKIEPAVEEADKALESGSVEKVIKLVIEEAAAGMRRRFEDARQKQAHAEHSVDAGREFVAAYVDYVHYVEGLHQLTRAKASSHGDAHDTRSVEAARHEPDSPHKH